MFVTTVTLRSRVQMSGPVDISKFGNSLSTLERQEILQALSVFGLLNRDKVYLELTNEAVNFSKTENLNFSQLCGLVSIINGVLKELSSSAYDNIQNVLGVLDKMMMSYSIQRPPHCIELYSIADSLKCVEFLVDSLFRHWRLYKFALAPTVRLVPQLIYDRKDYESEITDQKPSGIGLLYSILKYALQDQIENEVSI
ncbi:Coiled-coil domain-containing protein [Schistosoma japonicum]|nr:Coiled-coil domain-containing protein [Schistosoma japonicum]